MQDGGFTVGLVVYSIKEGIVTLHAEGGHTMADVQLALDAALRDEALPTRGSLLIDVCRWDATPGQKEIMAFAGFLRSVQEVFPRPCAVLTCDILRYGLSMALAGWAGASGVGVRVFRQDENDQARAWLLSGAPREAEGGLALGERTPQ